MVESHNALDPVGSQAVQFDTGFSHEQPDAPISCTRNHREIPIAELPDVFAGQCTLMANRMREGRPFGTASLRNLGWLCRRLAALEEQPELTQIEGL